MNFRENNCNLYLSNVGYTESQCWSCWWDSESLKLCLLLYLRQNVFCT